MMYLTFLILMGNPAGKAAEPPNLDALLQGVQRVYDQAVKASGEVDYALLAARPDLMAHLDAFVAAMADRDMPEDPMTRVALLANVYNVFTLVGVMRAWPVASVRKIHPLFGFFTRGKWQAFGEKVSLNDIENKWLRPLDVRIHFIINCASASCPVLLPTVLTADNVDGLMDRATRDFLNDASKNRFDREADVWRLSKIFDWYQKDWDGEDGLIAFIHRYRPDLADWRPAKIKYVDYDWSLNGPTEAGTGLD